MSTQSSELAMCSQLSIILAGMQIRWIDMWIMDYYRYPITVTNTQN